jgi:hypothetical protein
MRLERRPHLSDPEGRSASENLEEAPADSSNKKRRERESVFAS